MLADSLMPGWRMQSTATYRVRQFLEVLQMLVTITLVGIVGWQVATKGWPALETKLAAFAVVAVLVEAMACLMDVAVTQGVGEKLVWRIVAFMIGIIFAGIFAIPALVYVQRMGQSPGFLVLAFLAPRFVSFVLMPPRDELDRLRVVACARDRFDSILLAIALSPLALAAAATCIVKEDGGTPPTLITVLCGFILAWLLFLLAAVVHDNSAKFARYPLRLYNPKPWSSIVLFFVTRQDEKNRHHRDLQQERNTAAAWQKRSSTAAQA